MKRWRLLHNTTGINQYNIKSQVQNHTFNDTSNKMSAIAAACFIHNSHSLLRVHLSSFSCPCQGLGRPPIRAPPKSAPGRLLRHPRRGRCATLPRPDGVEEVRKAATCCFLAVLSKLIVPEREGRRRMLLHDSRQVASLKGPP